MGIFLLRQMLFGFAKVCVGDFKNRSASRADTVAEDYGKAPFQNASSVKLQQKVQKNSRMFGLFGEFHFHLFRSHCLKSHVFRATRSGDSADFVLHAFDRPHFSRVGVFALSSLFLVLGIGLFNWVPMWQRPLWASKSAPGLTKSRKLSVLLFRVFLLRVAYCRVDVTPFRRVQHLTIFYWKGAGSQEA